MDNLLIKKATLEDLKTIQNLNNQFFWVGSAARQAGHNPLK